MSLPWYVSLETKQAAFSASVVILWIGGARWMGSEALTLAGVGLLMFSGVLDRASVMETLVRI